MSRASLFLNKGLRNGPGFQKYLGSTVLLGLVLLLGITLRFYNLGTESYWLDEVYTVHMAQRNVDQLLAVRELNWPPAYYVLIHFWVRLFGTTETATRSLSVLAGIASIAIIYFLGRELFEKRVGLLGALLMAISEFQIYYSQETRFYSLFALTTLLSIFFYIKALRSRNTAFFLIYLATSILLFYSHAFGIFIIAAQNLHFLLRWQDYRKVRFRWLFCQAVLFLAIAPIFLPNILEGKRIAGVGVSTIGWIPDPPISALFRTVYEYLFPLRHDRSWTAVGLSFAAGIAFFVIGTALFAHWMGKKQWFTSVKNLLHERHVFASKANGLLLLGCWFLCPLVFPFVLSKLIGPMYVDRYTISASPALYLMIAFGITRIGKIVPVAISLTALAIIVAPGLVSYYGTPVKEQWREAAAFVTANASDRDVVVFSLEDGGWQQKCFNWYYHGNRPECGINKDLKDKDDEAIADALAKCTSGHERFWLIMRGTLKTVRRFKAFFLNSKYTDMRLIVEPPFKGLSVYLYESPRR
jgi:4-amino-4-deoxy-L-arabinose transferase-like glycosyltransferase